MVAATTRAAQFCHRLLIIEDNPDGRVSLQSFLRLLGHEVAVAVDGPEGIEMALRLQPEAAIVDIGLPGCDGFEVARRVRAALHETIRLIALTAYSSDETRRRAAASGFDAFLCKPADLDELIHLLGHSDEM